MVATAQNKELKELDALKERVLFVFVFCFWGKELGFRVCVLYRV